MSKYAEAKAMTIALNKLDSDMKVAYLHGDMDLYRAIDAEAEELAQSLREQGFSIFWDCFTSKYEVAWC